MENIKNIIKDFIDNYLLELIKNGYVYNEFSLQHELGLFLMNRLNKENFNFDNMISYKNKVYYEKNVKDFGEEKEWVKKEIDILIKDDKDKYYAIELKFPKNGQVPEQMYHFLKDIKFMEQVKECKNVVKSYVLTLVDDHNYYEGRRIDNEKTKQFYNIFRNENIVIKKDSRFNNPFSESVRDNDFVIDNDYKFSWKSLGSDGESEYKYYFVEVGSSNE